MLLGPRRDRRPGSGVDRATTTYYNRSGDWFPLTGGFGVVKLIFAILALSMAVGTTAARAQTYDPNYPVCMHVFGALEGERMDCIFTSIAQCEASASGRPAMCVINPYFAPTDRRRR